MSSGSSGSVAEELWPFGEATVTFILYPYHSMHICWFGHTLIAQPTHGGSLTRIMQWGQIQCTGWVSCFPSHELCAQMCAACPPVPHPSFSLYSPGILPITVCINFQCFLCKAVCFSSPLSFPGNRGSPPVSARSLYSAMFYCIANSPNKIKN